MLITGAQIFKGLTGGINTEKSVLNIVATELEKDSRNIEVLHDSSIRPRRGVDFIGLSASSAYIHTTRTDTIANELNQESPSGIYAPFKTTTGNTYGIDIIFQNLSFKLYLHPNLVNFDTPLQTITPTVATDISTEQLGYTVSFKFAKNRVFFAGKFIKPGYLYLKNDNTTIGIKYISMHIRNLDTATAESDRVQHDNKYYECVRNHTSATSQLTDLDSYGETVFNQFWVELDISTMPSMTPAWANGISYTSNIEQVINKHAAVGASNPFTVDYHDDRLWLGRDDNIYYSQTVIEVDNEKVLLTGTNEFGLFFSYNDPFSTDIADPLPTDGGVIPIASGKVWQIAAVEDSMFVGTSLSIYEIKGNSSTFSSTDFKSPIILTDGINGVGNMIVADSKLYIFGTGNIWTTDKKQINYQGSTTNFLKTGNTKINEYYRNITKLAKGAGFLVHSPSKEKIYFFHNGNKSLFDNTHRNFPGQTGYAYNILVIDISVTGLQQDDPELAALRNHLELWELPDTANNGAVYIAGSYLSSPISAEDTQIVVGLSEVYSGSSDIIVKATSIEQVANDEIVILVLQRVPSGSNIITKASAGLLESRNLRDWESDSNNVSDYTATAYLGTQTFDTLMDNKTVPYAMFIFDKLTPGNGSCLFRSSFNFASPDIGGIITGKTSGQTEIYKDTKLIGSGSISMDGYKVTTYKHQINGRGLAFQPSLQNTPGKDFKLLGWGQLAQTRRRQ